MLIEKSKKKNLNLNSIIYIVKTHNTQTHHNTTRFPKLSNTHTGTHIFQVSLGQDS